MIQVRRKFDPTDPNYFCCCGSCHVLSGAKIFALIFWMMITLYGMSVSRMDMFYDADSSVASFYLGIMIDFVIVIFLWYGLSTERKGFLIPYMIYSIFCIVIYVCLAALILHGLVSGVSLGGYHMYSDKGEVNAMWLYLEFVMLVSIGLQSWFFIIVKNAYFYLEHKQWAMTAVGAEVQQVVVVVPTEDTAPLIDKDESVA